MASVGDDTVKHAAQLDNQGTWVHTWVHVGGVFAVAATGGRVRSVVRAGEPFLRTRGMIGSLKCLWQGTHEAVT